MNISAFSIKNPVIIIIFFLISTFAGLISFNSMKVQQFPDMSLPTITVNAVLPGASPSQLETDVAKKLENSIASLQGIKNISTKIMDGSVMVVAEFRLEKSTQEALDDVRSAVSAIRSQLPNDLQDPVVNKITFAGSPILTYAIDSEKMDIEQLSWYVDNDISKRLLSVEGIGSVVRVGGVNRQIQVLIKQDVLKSFGVSIAEVSRLLKQIQLETSAGNMEIGSMEQPIKAVANVEQIQFLKDLEFKTSQGKKLRLGDVATIEDTVDKQVSGAFLNGMPVVGFEITRAKGASEIEVYEEIQKSLKQLQKERPDIKLKESFNFVNPVKQEYHASLTLLYEGALLAVLVVWLFLRDVRATFVSAVALPLSIIPAFIFMSHFGFSINIITLLALSLVVGILVDDAIVEVENIERHMAQGKTAMQAAVDATQEIGLAVIATTGTLIAVFLPTAFMSGIPGLFFKQFGWTAALSVFASLIVARLLTPMMAAYIMKHNAEKAYKQPFWMSFYLKTVKWSLENRFTTIVLALVFFVGSLSLIPLLPQGFIPADNNSQTQVYLELEPGVSYETTLAAAKKTEQLLKTVPEVLSVYTTIGGGASGSDPKMGGLVSSEVRKATLTIQLKDASERDVKQIIEKRIRQVLIDVAGAKIKVGLGASGEKYIMALTSEDGEALLRAAKDIEKGLRSIDGVGNITSSSGLNRSEVILKINYAKAAEYGITTESIAQSVRIATQGDFDLGLSKFNSSARQIPIVVKLDTNFKENLDSLKDLLLVGKNSMVPLSEVAEVELASGQYIIERYNRSRNITFEVELSGIVLGDLTAKVAELEAIKNLPPSVSVAPVGDAEMMQELFSSFGMAMLVGVLSIFFILVLLFKDILQPLTILMALPLALGGAFVGLLVAGQSFSMPSLIGLIMLMGLATKNSILLVEYAIVARRNGMPRFEAMLDACSKRARPIIMTTLAMGAGMLPIALQWGSGDGSFRSPMAIAVIGGLITSTFLSLVVIPAVYTYMDDFAKWVRLVVKK